VVEDLRSESRELSTLVEEVLALARGTTDTAPQEPVRVADAVSSVVERARRRTGRSITLDTSPAGRAAIVLGDRAALQRAVRNVVGPRTLPPR
jgi:two-component system sensor histidine kinase MprB